MTLVHVAAAVTGVSFVLYAAMMALFARALLRAQRAAVASTSRAPADAPRVSILKPLAGCDDDLDGNLESFARLAYPSFEILLGIADPSDPAVAVARCFALRHPGISVQVVVTDRNAATNPKVAQLVGLEKVAKGDILVISDSNVRVRSSYLHSLVGELADPRVGIVTSVFYGAGERTMGAALENLQLCVSTAPGIAAVDAVSSRPFTVGKSMAVRRCDLEKLGGFAPVSDVLAEDHVLGRRFMNAGFAARTSYDLVENRNVRCSMGRTLERHTRWAKMRRSLFPHAFALEPMITPVIVATIAFVLAPARMTAGLLFAACLVQTAAGFFAVRLIRGKALPWRYAPLEVARSYVWFFCWVQACMSRRITWRGHPFKLLRGSFILPLDEHSERSGHRARLAA